MDGVGGDEGGCLGAQAVVAHGDGDEAGIDGEGDLFGGEVAFGAAEDGDVRAGTQRGACTFIAEMSGRSTASEQ